MILGCTQRPLLSNQVNPTEVEGHPQEVKDAIQTLLAAKGKHPSPLSVKAKKAYDVLYKYEKPEEGIGDTLSDWSYNKTYYFRKCNITQYFTSNAKDESSYLFYLTVKE
jgi:hypothetical protein